MTYLLMLTPDQARQFLRYFDPNLGVPLEERQYADDCRVYTPEKEFMFQNIKDCVLDEFFLAHLFGWCAKVYIY